MSKIKIKNFGPIKEGLHEDDGFMAIKKVTLFIGNQGSGKSTIAKVISTLTWIEKAFNRGDFSESWSFHDFIEQFKYQNLDGYFKNDTVIEYVGEQYFIQYDRVKNQWPIIKKINGSKYVVPKIMYVPSERNFLSVIKDAYSVRGLPEPLFEFAEELRKSQEFIGTNGILLPVNNVYYKYDPISETGIIYNNEYSVNMTAASSGFQSFVPLFLVSKNLSELLSKDNKDLNPNTVSVSQKLRFNSEITKISLSTILTNEQKQLEFSRVISKYINKSFINIVEEPEQNLFPSSQQKMLNSLLKFNNISDGNKLIMTTHSPYLINYLTLTVKAGMVKSNLSSKDSLDKLAKIVPLESTVISDDLVIYELDERDGFIKKLPEYNGLPSDENKLNYSLEDSNELFAQLLEIQQGL